MAKNHEGFSKQNVLNVSLCCVVLVAQFDIYQASDTACGTKNVTRPLVKGGVETVRGEWPFATALYLVNPSKYICGGTLISNKHVLTAAHCIQGKFSPAKLQPNEVTVRIGAYNLGVENEVGSVQRNVTDIYVHPEWLVYEDEYDADIAILVLSDNITFTNYIRSICMPSNDVNITGTNGFLVGWGAAENEAHEEIQRQGVTKILNDLHCYRRDYVIIPMASVRTFCGGDGEGVPNRGDSGGGLFVFSGTSWVQYGIISAIRSDSYGQVQMNSLAVYTNVKLFKNWINDTVTRSGSAVSEAFSNQINLRCKYENIYWERYVYTCYLNNLDIRNDNVEVVSGYTGSHRGRNTNYDVEVIEFINGTMVYFPNGIGKLFKGVRKVNSNFSLGTKHLRRSNLKDFALLIEFRVVMNEIETLEEDSLRDLSHLRSFDLRHNKLIEIKENTFLRNYFLEKVNLGSNKLKFLPQHLFHNNPMLEIVDVSNNSLKLIDDQIFIDNLQLKEVWLNLNQLEFLPENLFRNNLLLEIISFEANSLKTIYNDFTGLKNINKIIFSYNRCIDTNYVGTNILEQFSNELRDLIEFQRVINANCTSVNS